MLYRDENKLLNLIILNILLHKFIEKTFIYFSEGTRRDNVEKNIGKRIYAFNSVQRSTLPASYQPPVGTFGKTKT